MTIIETINQIQEEEEAAMRKAEGQHSSPPPQQPSIPKQYSSRQAMK